MPTSGALEEYFSNVNAKRRKSDEERAVWKFQTDPNKDPIDEWKRLRKEGVIKDLKREGQDGGIPIPMASFGVGGEFGQGGAYDNGERFDLRLPYADQGTASSFSHIFLQTLAPEAGCAFLRPRLGYVDEDADVMGKLFGAFSGKKNKQKNGDPATKEPEAPKPTSKKSGYGRNP